MAKYRKKPVVVDAIQWNGENLREIYFAFGTKSIKGPDRVANAPPDTLEIVTLEGNHLASKGDFIIRGIKGELYPCKPDIFEATYDKVEDDHPKIP